ncbi:hypothetical protein SLS62_000675 [Diatrype stigma]|uniref:Aminotransferase class I/classII large domain-containing protein n=1 Tax=Diatrype stigma TaxID=117547 RepID=A0AAN9YSA9_9PEZI
MSLLSPTSALVTRIKGQQVPSSMANSQIFYQNLEESLDVRRASHTFYSIVDNNWQTEGVVDFCSNDQLSLSSSGVLRAEFLAELAKYPGFPTGSTGSRLIDGNYKYLEQAEKDIATFHGAEEGLIFHSGFDANVAIWTAIPRPGDVLLYDESVHASTHEGMKQSLASQRFDFQHNHIESFRDALASVFDTIPLIKQGKRSVIIAVESVYSMDGDMCPLQEFVEIAADISCGRGNVQFVVDEAHSTGLFGPQGRGFVCELGLEKDIALVIHTFGKAMGSAGVEHPVVPLNQSRLRITLHAANTEDEVEGLAQSILAWADETLAIEEGRSEEKVTQSARVVYDWMKHEGLVGFGLT